MTLTPEDLSAISQILDEKLEEKLETKLEAKLDEKLETKLEDKLETKLDNKFDDKFETKLNERLNQIFDEKLQPLKDDILAIRLDIENDLKPNIKLLAENYVPAAVRYEETSEKKCKAC